jgi:hypothetical protein
MTNFELIKQHEYDTRFCSTFGHMQKVSTTYKEIIAKGEEIVPDILKYLKDTDGGMDIIMLLYVITGASPYEPETTKFGMMVAYNVKDAQQAWIDWGKENNYI